MAGSTACDVLYCDSVWRAPYAMCGTELAYGGQCMCGTELAYSGRDVRMCGTELAYGGRAQGRRWYRRWRNRQSSTSKPSPPRSRDQR
eukprot:817942-Rhodomonas_salina.1